MRVCKGLELESPPLLPPHLVQAWGPEWIAPAFHAGAFDKRLFSKCCTKHIARTHVHKHTCIRTYVRTYIHTCMHACIHTCYAYILHRCVHRKHQSTLLWACIQHPATANNTSFPSFLTMQTIGLSYNPAFATVTVWGDCEVLKFCLSLLLQPSITNISYQYESNRQHL